VTTTRLRIVGVVEDILYHSSGEPAAPMVYGVRPAASSLGFFGPLSSPVWLTSFVMSVAPGQASLVANEVRNRTRERFPDMIPPRVTPLDDVIAQQAMPQRIAARVALGVGAVELMLAAAGLYGLLLFVLTSQTRELGIRLALGASAVQAGWAVLRAGLRYALVGGGLALLLGVVGLGVGERLLPGLVEGSTEPFLAAAAAVLVAVGAASLVPGWRASRVRPAVALRDE
jgi:hypothetical protein